MSHAALASIRPQQRLPPSRRAGRLFPRAMSQLGPGHPELRLTVGPTFMQVRTATCLAGGMGRSPFSNPSVNRLLPPTA